MPTDDPCTLEPHVHASPDPVVVMIPWVVHVDHTPVAVCLDRRHAQRLADLLTEHGLYEIPDHLPDDLIWGPPITDPQIDWRLPTDPTMPSL